MFAKLTKIFSLNLLLAVMLFGVSCSSGPKRVPWLNSESFQVKKIALFLPLSNAGYKNEVKAIKNGFLFAYYRAKKNNHEEYSLVVKDSGDNVTENYDKLANDGVSVVVGPLLKHDVASLLDNEKTFATPILTLSVVPGYYRYGENKKVFHFGISYADEVDNIVQKARAGNLEQSVIVTDNNRNNILLAKTLTKKLTDLKVKVFKNIVYYSPDQFGQEIKNYLVTNNEDGTLNSQKVDAIFILTAFAKAREINPQIKFYQESPIPVYAISSVYSGNINQNEDRDLDGIEFCDMPFILESATNDNFADIESNLQALFGNNFKKYKRFYALGFDAYYLSVSLGKIANYSAIGALTGNIFLDSHQHIFRRLPFAKFTNGLPVLE